MIAQVVYGWLHGGTGEMLYVYQKKDSWGVSKKLSMATSFRSIEAANEHYLSKHAFPEDYEASTTNGYLKYMDIRTKQIILF